MHPNAVHIPISPYVPLTPTVSPQKKPPQLIYKNKQKTLTSLLSLSNTSLFILMALGASVWLALHITFCPVSHTHKIFIAVRYCSSSRSMTPHHLCTFTKTSLLYSVVAPSQGDSAFIVPQN